MTRIYNFPLPYQIDGMQDGVGIDDLKQAGLWEQLPSDLQKRMSDGAGLFAPGVTVTAGDLDKLPDKVWAFIADHLGLNWTKGAPPP